MVLIGRQDQNVVVVHFKDLISQPPLPLTVYHIDEIVNNHSPCGVHTRLLEKAIISGV